MNQRVIKFRAWDMKSGYMRTHFDGWSENADVLCSVFETIANDYSYALMQYTGLKDKNGVDIYESDVLDYGYKKGVVVFYDGGFFCVDCDRKCCEAQYNNMTPYECIMSGGTPVEVDFIKGISGTIPTVIGNVFEHPDLLK